MGLSGEWMDAQWSVYTKVDVIGSLGDGYIPLGERSLYPQYDFKSHFWQVGSHRLHYVDEGTGPVVVMVHGNPTWSYFYRHLIQLLAPQYRIIAIDHMGCGLSDKPQDYPYTLERHIDNLQGLLVHLGIERYSLVVHDWGGAIGFGCAVRDPGRVEKIVVLNTAAFHASRIPLRIRVCRWPLFNSLLVRGLNGFAWPATFMAVTKPLNREVAAAYLAPYNSWHSRVAVAAFVKDIPLSSGDVSYDLLTEIEQGPPVLREKGVPMLLLWGGRDFCFNRYFYDQWCNRFPEAERHYFDDGGHYILEDKRREIAPLLLEFFRRPVSES